MSWSILFCNGSAYSAQSSMFCKVGTCMHVAPAGTHPQTAFLPSEPAACVHCPSNMSFAGSRGMRSQAQTALCNQAFVSHWKAVNVQHHKHPGRGHVQHWDQRFSCGCWRARRLLRCWCCCKARGLVTCGATSCAWWSSAGPSALSCSP